jgi:hypothetical protein
MSRATAYRFISVADTMGTYIASHSETHFGSRVLYALASPDTPDEVCTEITKLAEPGEKVTVADVRAAKTCGRPAQPAKWRG